MRKGRLIGLALMVVAVGWLLYDSRQWRPASFPPDMDTDGSLLAWLVFVLGALVFVRDSYFKWREDQRAERAAHREEDRSTKRGPN